MQNVVGRQGALEKKEMLPQLGYANCGRKSHLADKEKQGIVDFVKRWRSKRFCTANYIIRELKLRVKKKTVHRVLNKAGFKWRAVPQKSKLSPQELRQRKEWVDARLHWTGGQWAKAFGLVLDGVTLSRAPKPLTGAQSTARCPSRRCGCKTARVWTMTCTRRAATAYNLATRSLCGAALREKLGSPTGSGLQGQS